MAKKRILYLDECCQVGDTVRWHDLTQFEYVGKIVKWDDNVATVKLEDGTEKTVTC